MRIPDELMDDQGKQVNVLRAWPRGDGSLVIEGREESTGRVRAGRIDAQGRTLLVPFRTDPSLPGLASDAPAGELLVHRLKRRAVIRTDGHYRKFIAGGKAPAVTAAHRAASSCLTGSGLHAPDVVASDEFSVTLTAVPGLSLHELGRSLAAQRDQWEQGWKLWADRWPVFVRTARSARSAVTRAHSAGDEVATVERWTRLALSTGALHVPETRVRDALASVARSLMAGGSCAGMAHRDLHDKQILADAGSGSVGIIDCDTLAVAEPALDLANLSVHLDFRVAQGLLPTSAAAVGKHHVRAAAESLRVPEARLNAYAQATALRLACIYAFRPPYRTTAHTWFADLEANLHSRSFSEVAL